MNKLSVAKQRCRLALGGLVASLAFAGVALASPILILEIQGGNALTVGQTVNANLVVSNLGADEVVTTFDVNLNFDQSIAAASDLQINTTALDTDNVNSGAALVGNGFTLNFFGFTNAGVFNSNTFADLKSLQGGASGTFTLASFLLQGVGVGNSLINYSSPFIFAIETSSTFTVPLDLGDTAAGPDQQITVSAANNTVPLPGGFALALLGLAALTRASSVRRR
jgi:hypothetical protein